MRWRFSTSPSDTRPTSLAGRIFLTLFLSIFIAIGVLAVWMSLRDARRTHEASVWPKAPAEIVLSSIDESARRQGKFRVEVIFEYHWEGRKYRSEVATDSQPSFDSYREAQRWVDAHPIGARITCTVNPAQPREAVLEEARGSWTGRLLFASAFGLMFCLLPAAFIVAIWRAPRSSAALEARPLSRGLESSRSGLGGIVFAGLFIVVGLGMLVPFFIRPLARVLDARSWKEVPCRIESSAVRTSTGESTTYAVEILYAYRVRNREFKSNRYSLGMQGVTSSGRSGKEAIVARYPEGSAAVCYVDPQDPTMAVLNRGFEPTMLIGLFPLIFIGVGIAVLVGSRRAASLASNARGSLPAVHPSPVDPRGFTTSPSAESTSMGSPTETPVVLKPSASPTARFVGTLLVALFWNGIVGLFVSQVLNNFRHGFGEWFAVLFLVPFVLIGLGMLVATGYFFATLFNPRPVVTLSTSQLHPGGTVQIGWQFQGRVERVQRLSMRLVGREVVRYRRGTNTVRDESIFTDHLIFESPDRPTIRHGAIEFAIPPTAIPTFQASNNELVWVLQVLGDIEHWADVREEFPLTLGPGPLATESENPPADSSAETPEPVRSESGHLQLGTKNGVERFRPGEKIEGGAGWSLPTPPRSLEVRLFWFTSGKGTRDTRTDQVHRFVSPAAQEVQSFAFLAPEVPWSCDGRLLSVQWALELVLNDGQEVARFPLSISPTGRPWVLPAAPPNTANGPWWKRWQGRNRA